MKHNHPDYPVLKTSSLFAGLSEMEFNKAAAFIEPVIYKKDAVPFKEGDSGKEMFIHIFGKISAYATQSNGVQRWLFDVKIGDFFGEMSIIANEPRSATLISAEDSVVMVLQGIDFYRMVFEYPAIGIKLFNAISGLQNAWLDQTSTHLSDLSRWGETARRRAITDELTGLYNRRFLEESIKNRFHQGFVQIRPMTLLMLDLDKVHEINSRHGQAGGDRVFLAAAGVIRSVSRSEDIGARLAGDEFSVLLPDTGEKDARAIAERIREGIFYTKVPVPRAPDAADKVEINIRTSIGLAVAPVHADTWEKLFVSADNALRKAKELGRNRVESAG
jgi:diguanylate cyclase (GGDEF)-like protein